VHLAERADEGIVGAYDFRIGLQAHAQHPSRR
jgi:hypothetical protein